MKKVLLTLIYLFVLNNYYISSYADETNEEEDGYNEIQCPESGSKYSEFEAQAQKHTDEDSQASSQYDEALQQQPLSRANIENAVLQYVWTQKIVQQDTVILSLCPHIDE